MKLFSLLAVFVLLASVAGCKQEEATPTSQPNTGNQVTSSTPPQSSGTQQTSSLPAPSDLRATGPNNTEYLKAIPMTQRVKAQKGSVDTSSGVNLLAITWGGDVQEIYANGNAKTTQTGSIFAQKGLKINISREDNLDQQVIKVISGYTPYLRGTMGMANCALEALAQQGIEMVAIYQLTYSLGGDTATVRDDLVKTAQDLRGKTIVMQMCGPHPEFLSKILQDSNLTFNDVTIKWTRELTIPPYNSRGIAVDPFTAMQRDESVAAAMLISPDMLVATKGKTIGVGGESIKGAKLLVDTKSAGRVIADLYYVRKDYLDAHPQEVQNFVHGMMIASEEVTALYNNRQNNPDKYQAMLRASAEILRDSPQATGDIEGLLGDATFVGHAGNVQFFTGVGTTRTYETLHQEAENALIALGLRSTKIMPKKANWDYRALAAGLRNAGTDIPTPAPKFDQTKVEQFAAGRQGTGSGSLYKFQITFPANEDKFPIEQYNAEFSQAVKWADTYTGAIIIVTGYADTWLYNQEKLQYQNHPQRTVILGEKEQAAKNTSLLRAQRVKESILELARKQGVLLDPSQITVVGSGFSNALYPNPVPENDTQCTQCAANRRVVFELIPVEVEAVQFGKK